MFREIMVGQELINKDQLDEMQDRQQEKLRELQRDVVNLGNMKDKKSDDKSPVVPQTAQIDKYQIEEMMETLEKRIMDKMKAEFEPIDTKPKKMMMV